jgi:hypothetical protein
MPDRDVLRKLLGGGSSADEILLDPRVDAAVRGGSTIALYAALRKVRATAKSTWPPLRTSAAVFSMRRRLPAASAGGGGSGLPKRADTAHKRITAARSAASDAYRSGGRKSSCRSEVARSPWGDGPAYPVQQLVVGLDGERVVEAALFAWSDDAGDFVEIARLPGAAL